LQFAAPANSAYLSPPIGNPNKEIDFALTRCLKSSFEAIAKSFRHMLSPLAQPLLFLSTEKVDCESQPEVQNITPHTPSTGHGI
jgi:hypothetical protein